MKLVLIMAALLCTALGPVAVAQGATCGDASVTTRIPAATPALDWSENVGYDADGNLWVSRTIRSEVQRYDRSGRLTATVPVAFPGAIRLGPDRMMYVTSGNTPLGMVVRSGTVIRFDPAAPVPTVFATGLGMPNGAGFDAAGNLYIADGGGAGLTRIRPDGTIDAEWTARAPKNFDLVKVNGTGINGLAVAGDSIYVTVLQSLAGGRVLRVPIDAPERSSVVVDLLPNVVSALPDDLVAGPGGALYATTATGQLLRIDPAAHAVCVLASTEPMTSIAAVPDAPGEFVAGTELGAILRIRIG